MITSLSTVRVVATVTVTYYNRAATPTSREIAGIDLESESRNAPSGSYGFSYSLHGEVRGKTESRVRLVIPVPETAVTGTFYFAAKLYTPKQAIELKPAMAAYIGQAKPTLMVADRFGEWHTFDPEVDSLVELASAA